jgi:uncharacterized membrane protein
MFILAIVATPLMLWAFYYAVLPNTTFEMDPGGNRGSFVVFHAIYDRIARLLFITSWVVSAALYRFGPEPKLAIFFMAAAVYSMVFMVWIAMCYERYSAERYSAKCVSPYHASHYALTMALGISSGFMFAVGIILTIVALGATK